MGIRYRYSVDLREKETGLMISCLVTFDTIKDAEKYLVDIACQYSKCTLSYLDIGIYLS